MFKGNVMSRKITSLSVLLVIASASACALAEVPKKTQYRGFTVTSMNQKDLETAVKRWNANQVRYMMCPVWWAPNRAPGHYQATWKKILDELPAGLDRAKALGLAVVLDLHQVPNDNVKQYSEDPKEDSHLYWKDPENRRVFVECWQQLAEICKDRDQVIWFDLLNEPTDWTTVHNPVSYPPELPRWYRAAIHAIRKIDTKHPIVIETGPGMLSWGFTKFPPLKDPCQPLIYSTHPYMPCFYSHQGVNDNKVLAWLGEFGDHGGGMWDRKRIEEEMAPAIEFQKKYNVRLYMGEFSAPRWAPDAAAYLQDVIDMMEKHGWDWNYHSINDAPIWRLELSEDIDLYDKDGKYVKTAVADPKEGLFFAPYGTPDKVPVKEITDGFTARGQVVKRYLDKNLTTFRNVLVVGNSLTRHGPSEAISWPNDCGMAATSEDKDFAHILFKKICDNQPTVKPELQLANVTNEAAMTGYEHLLPCKADLIIIELGDNYRGKADEAELQKPYEKIIAALAQGHPCRVLCVSAWGNTGLNPFIQKAAEKQGATYVEISDLFQDVNNRAASEGHFKHDGVNWHPGDRGMQKIAEAIWAAMGVGQ